MASFFSGQKDRDVGRVMTREILIQWGETQVCINYNLLRLGSSEIQFYND